MWTYDQSTGEFFWHGMHRFDGYSGKNPEGLNNGSMQAVPSVGPIPSGHYRMIRYDKSRRAPPVIALIPLGHSAFGRTLFRIHGDSDALSQSASEGCIILCKPHRQRLLDSGDDLLEVVP